MMVIMRRKNMMVIMIMESCQKMMLCYIWCYTLRQARGTGVGDHYQCQACLFCHYTTHSSSYNIIIMQHHHHHKSKNKNIVTVSSSLNNLNGWVEDTIPTAINSIPVHFDKTQPKTWLHTSKSYPPCARAGPAYYTPLFPDGHHHDRVYD